MTLNTARACTGQTIHTWVRDQVGIIQISAGGLLSESAELYNALAAEVARFNKDSSIHGVVIAGAGSHFLSLPSETTMGARQDVIQKGFEAIRGVSKPTVAAINGSTAVIGLEVALACDARICSPAARFPTGFRELAAPECNPAISIVLPRVVGPGWARLMAFSDRFISADRALRIGLVDEVVIEDRIIDRAVEIASRSPETAGFYDRRLN